jgi:transposase
VDYWRIIRVIDKVVRPYRIKAKEALMKDYRTVVGLDVHKSSISAAAANKETGEVTIRRFDYDVAALVKWLHTLEGPLTCCYESGFCGFSLKRSLERHSIPCDIVATSKLARPAGDKVKTDKRDAVFLVGQYMARNENIVSGPGLDCEGFRDLSRLHACLRDSLGAAKHRVSQMCLRYGLRWEGKQGRWTQAHLRWLKGIRMPSAPAQAAFEGYLSQVIHLGEEKARVASLIEGYCKADSLNDLVEALCAIKGISHISAFCLISEIGDFTRFSHAPLFASYLGLVPSEHSSGDHASKGPITKTGNKRVRKMLIEVAMCIIRQKDHYKKAADTLSAEVCRRSARANRRLAKKRDMLKANKKHVCKAAAAIARELSGFIWDIACIVQSSPRYAAAA